MAQQDKIIPGGAFGKPQRLVDVQADQSEYAPRMAVILTHQDGTTYDASGGGGGGGAVTVADGADVAQGFKSDAPVTDPAAAATVLARLAGLEALLQPVSVSGTLADPAIPDALVLALGGRQGATFILLDDSTTSDYQLSILESFDGGLTYPQSPYVSNPSFNGFVAGAYDSGGSVSFGTNGVSAQLAKANLSYPIPLPIVPDAGATHLQVRLDSLNSGAIAVDGVTVSVRLAASAVPAMPPTVALLQQRYGSDYVTMIGAISTTSGSPVKPLHTGAHGGVLVETVAQSVVQSMPLSPESGSIASRDSGELIITNAGLNLVVHLANFTQTSITPLTITPRVQGQTLTGILYDLWTAAAPLSGNGTYVYQLGPMAATAVAGGITEGKVALIPGVIHVLLDYTGDGATDTVDTRVDMDVTP